MGTGYRACVRSLKRKNLYCYLAPLIALTLAGLAAVLIFASEVKREDESKDITRK